MMNEPLSSIDSVYEPWKLFQVFRYAPVISDIAGEWFYLDRGDQKLVTTLCRHVQLLVQSLLLLMQWLSSFT